MSEYFNTTMVNKNRPGFITNTLEVIVLVMFMLALVAGVEYFYKHYTIHVTPRVSENKTVNNVESFNNRNTNNNEVEFEPVPVDCVVSPDKWTDWSHCTKTCGGGTSTRKRIITQLAQHGGLPCPTDNDMSETRACNTHAC